MATVSVSVVELLHLVLGLLVLLVRLSAAATMVLGVASA